MLRFLKCEFLCFGFPCLLTRQVDARKVSPVSAEAQSRTICAGYKLVAFFDISVSHRFPLYKDLTEALVVNIFLVTYELGAMIGLLEM